MSKETIFDILSSLEEIYSKAFQNLEKGIFNKKYEHKLKIREYKHQNYLQNKEKILERSRKWTKDNKEHAKETKKIYYQKNSETIKQKVKDWSENNKEWIKEQRKDFRSKNKELLKQRTKEYRLKNPERVKELSKKSAERRKDKIKIYKDKYYIENREWILEEQKERTAARFKERLQIRVDIFNLFGGKCAWCPENDCDVLVIDHINDDGAADRKENKIRGGFKIVERLIKRGVSETDLKQKYQCLCANHNSIKQYKKYFDLLDSELTNAQRYKIKLWKEAFNFFGPCKMCKESNLKCLSIDHIHGNGNEKRKNGEPVGTTLLGKFRQMGWPESIKEEYQLLCFNCHYGRKPKIKNPNLSVRALLETI